MNFCFKLNEQYKLYFLQNIPIIFFSAAKCAATKERKISEDQESSPSEKLNDSGAETGDSEDESDVENPNALNDTEDDIEMFKRQLGELDTAVNKTANKIDAIQEALDRVLENLRLGKPIEPFQSDNNLVTENADTCNTEDVEKDGTNTNNSDFTKDLISSQGENIVTDENKVTVQNSCDIFDRDRLLQVLKGQKLDRLKNPPRVTVGMIGYPNVGKSSSVNILMQTKKVSFHTYTHL